MPVALVVGGSGLVGAHLIRELLAADWQVIATQRREPVVQPPGYRIVSLELGGDTAAQARLDEIGRTGGATHLFFLARVWRPGYLIEREENVTALRTVLDVAQNWPTLRHVQLVHGLKWYGSTAGPFHTPARETDVRPAAAHFYYEQRDLLAARQPGQRWTWTTLRPHCVSGVALDSPSNIMLGMGAYAALAAGRGDTVAFPASAAAFEARLTYTSAELLARAMRWAALDERACNQDFNVANGDTFRWCDVWPAVASSFGATAGAAAPVRLSEAMPRRAGEWRELSSRRGLAASDLTRLVDWHFMDASLALEWDQVMSTEKLAAAGFGQTVDTPAMIDSLLREYQRRAILPQ